MRGLYMAEGGMLTQQAKLELTGNNLSNQRTPGYKKDEAVQSSFAEWLTLRTNVDMPSGRQGRRPVGTMAYNVALEEDFTHLTQGSLEPTDRSLDLALEGEGFFQVEVDGEMHYTRNGHFYVDEEGFLVDTQGNPVQGEVGPIEVGRGELEVTDDGTVFVDGAEVDQLEIMDFEPEANLAKVGDNYLVPEEEIEAEPDVQVWQGFLENSNVDMTEEVVNLIESRQNYESVQRAMMTYDSLLERSANELGAV